MIKYTLEHYCDACGKLIGDAFVGEINSSAVQNYRLPMMGNLLGYSAVCNECFDFATKALHEHRLQVAVDLH